MNQPTTPNTVEDLLPLPTPAWARDVHGETEVYTADQVRAAILADRARLTPAAPSGEAEPFCASFNCLLHAETGSKYCCNCEPDTAPSEIEAAVELPPKPEPTGFYEWLERHRNGVTREDRWYDSAALTSYATEAVLKDRANRKGPQ